MNKIITIDCDNVLCDTSQGFLKYYELRYGAVVAFEELNKPYPHELEVFAKFRQDDMLAAYTDFFDYSAEHNLFAPVLGSQSAVAELSEAGYELHVVTGRADIQRDSTLEWITKHFTDLFAEVHFTNDRTAAEVDKGTICQQVGAVVHLDDFYHYAETIAAVEIPTLLFDNPWNKEGVETPYIKRVRGWQEAMSQVIEQ